MAKSVEKQIEEYKKSISDGRKKAEKIRKESVKSETWGSGTSGLPVVTDPVASVQRMREAAVQPKDVSMPSQSQIRADAARKRLDRLRTDYDAKTKARADKQKEDQFYSDLLTGDPSVIAPMAAPDEEENRLRQQVEQADREVKYWENQGKMEQNAAVARKDMEEMEQWDEADRAELEKYIANKQQAFVQSLNPAMTGVPASYEDSPLIAKYGRQRLDEIARTYQREQNRQKYEQAEKTGREQADGGLFAGIGANAASVGANLADALLNPLQRIAQMAAGTDDRYSTLDPYAGGQAAAYASGVRQQTQENIEGEDPGAARKAASIGYQDVMVAADSLARGAVGGTPVVGAGLAALGSFNRTVSDASAKGASPEQAVALATINSGIEAATEKLPLDELFKVAKGGAKPAAQIVVNVLKQMGVEIAEEEASLIGTTLAEAAILREKSSYNQQVMAAVQQGASLEEARAQANHALLAEAINTALVSGVSGAVSAGGAEIFAARKGAAETAQQSANAEIEAGQQQELPEGQEQTVPEAAEGPDPEQDQIAALLEGIREEPQEQKKPDNLDEAMGELFSEKDAENAPTEQEAQQQREESFRALDDSDAPDEKEPSYPGSENMDWGADPFRGRKWAEMGDRKTKAFMHENPEVKEIFQEEAGKMLWDLSDTTRGERSYDEELHYETGGEEGWTGVKRHTSEDIAELRDSGMTYEQIEKGLQAIVEDHGKENNANSKRIEFVINDRLRDGYKDFHTNKRVPPNQEYIDMIDDKMLDEDRKEGFDALMEDADEYAPAEQNAETSTPRADIQRQSLKEGQVKGTGAAERNFTGKAAYQDLLKEGNTQPDRPGDVRPMEVPRTDGNGKRVTDFAANAYGAGVTTDEMANTIESLIQDGELGFNVRTNRESLDNAAAAIKKRGPAATRKQLTNRIDHRKIQDGDIEQGILLYARYAEQGDNDNASEMLVDLAQMANITGRNLQMFKLLRRMTVEGQVMTLQKEVKKSVESMIHSGQVKKGYEPSFDPELMDGYRKALEELRLAKDPKAQEAAKLKAKEIQEAIYAAEAAKMPATFKAKWDAWRYMAMLGNAKTQIRNVAGNIMFEPYKATKDKMAALFEKALPQDQRTKALVQDPALLKWARNDSRSADVQDALKYTAKLGDDATSQKIAEQMKVFDSKALEGLRRLTAKAPQAGDMLFKNDYYARSLAGFLKARGYSAQQIRSGEVSADAMIEARTYAIDEAMKATFNDSNAFSDAIASIGRRDSDNPWVKTLSAAAEGVLPFRRTPANILVRFSEYSPAGLAKGMWDMATHVRKGDLSAAAAIDQITAGLTGSGMMYLGYMMAAGMNGIKLTGSGADEDEKRQGHQDYALEFCVDGKEYSYRIDWAAPANLPLFVGANIYNAMQKSGADPDVSKFTSILRGMGTAVEPMLALSCMSSLNDLVESTRYAEEGEALYTIAANMTTSYFTQGVPALARQAYQASQENKQATFANDPDPTIRDLQKTAAQVPFLGDQFQTEKRNAWGETENQGDPLTRAVNAFLNPGSLKEINNSDLEQEISRLNEAQTESVTPPTAGKTLSYTDKQGEAHKNVRLTEEQYQTLAQTQGQTAKRILDSMIGSKDYGAMTDSQKAAAIREVYSYARKTGEIAAIGDSHTGYEDAWMMELEEGKEADQILRRVTKAELTGAVSALDAAWDKGYDDAGRSDDLKWAFDTFKTMSPKAKQEVRDQTTGTAAKYIEAREKGVSHRAFVNAAENISKVKGTGSNGSIRDIDRREAIATTRGLSEKNIDAIMKCYMEDYDPENGKTATTELKYDYIRQELGLSPKQYAQTYRAHLDNSKKADKIAAMMELGYDKKTATALYNVYAGNSKGKAAYMSLYED